VTDLQSLLDPDALELVARLMGLPLALVTAGSYLRQSGDTCSEYLEIYEGKRNDLLHDINRPLSYDLRLFSIWDLSFQQVQAQDWEAAEVLRLAAYFANGVWYELLRAGADEGPQWFRDIVQSRLRFNQTIAKLHDYSLIEIHPNGFSLHACVHEWALERLSQERDLELYSLSLNCVARSILSKDKAEHWMRNRELLSHTVRLEQPSFREIRAKLSTYDSYLSNTKRLGLLYQEQHMMTDADEMYRRALTGYEKMLGLHHPSTLDTLNNLGMLYSIQGKLSEAEQMYRRALKGREENLGRDHVSTLDTVNNLGNLYGTQGRLKEAEQMYMRALKGREENLGRDHMSTLETVNNLGNLYSTQGRLKEAEQMYMQALKGHEENLGQDHTSTLETVSNLGNLYSTQGRLKEAEQMYMRALKGREENLGRDHMSTLDIANNLGNLYRSQGKLSEAEQMYRRALIGRETVLGLDHISMLTTINNLGIIYNDQGRFVEAEEMYQRAQAVSAKRLGPDHISTLDIVNNLGILYYDQGKLAEAQEMYQRAIIGKEMVLGPEHMSTLSTVNNIGNLYNDQGNLTEAEEMYRRALTGYEKVLGPDHPSTFDILNNLAMLYSNQGKLNEAEQIYERALAGYERILGTEHPSTLNTTKNLGTLYSNQGKLREAEQMYGQALRGYEKTLPLEHPTISFIFDELEKLYRFQGKLAEAEKMSKAFRSNSEPLDDTFEVSSVLSLEVPSLWTGSTLSSINSDETMMESAGKFAELLLTDETLQPLYESALQKVGLERLERNLSKLLVYYAVDLRAEAGNSLEVRVAQLVKRYAKYIANYLRKRLDPSEQQRQTELDRLVSQEATSSLVEDYLQRSETADVPKPEMALATDESISRGGGDQSETDTDNSEESEQDASRHSSLYNFEHVRRFMLEAAAFAKLREKFRDWIESKALEKSTGTRKETETLPGFVALGKATKLSVRNEIYRHVQQFRDRVKAVATRALYFSKMTRGSVRLTPPYHKAGETVFTWTCVRALLLRISGR
jgi:tetratricopeptide (TPR) repeat protein